MRQRKLGNIGLIVSEIGMGTWELGGREWGDIGETDAVAEKGIAIVVQQPLSSGLLSGHLRPDTVFAENDYRKTWPREKFLVDLERLQQVKGIIGDKARSLPQAALKFILAHPAVSCVVPGMMTPAQIDDGVATSNAPPLPNTVLNQLRDN